MNPMKTTKRIFVLSALMTWALHSFVTAQVRESKDGNMVAVYFTSNLNALDLDKIKEDVKEHGITLVYNKLDFDRKGMLSSIDFSVIDSKRGSSGSAKTQSLHKDLTFGFFVNRTPGARETFGTGDIAKIE